MATNSDNNNTPVDNIARLGEIQFPEFTSKLITDTFEALISANLKQTESYFELVEQVSKSLTSFINDTKDDITGEDVLAFLAEILPDDKNKQDTIITKDNIDELDAETLEKINDATEIKEDEEYKPISVDGPETKISDKFDSILNAVSRRIAANKYVFLKQMVKSGILRLVVEEGVIESKLNFMSKSLSTNNSYSNNYGNNNQDIGARARLNFLKRAFRISGGARKTQLNVSTVSKFDQNKSEDQVQIFGGVKIKFKTDYQSLEI